MASVLVYFGERRKGRLIQRARLRGKSISQEVRDAVDLYLFVPVETEEELAALARAANRAADQMIKRLDETIACIDRELRHVKRGR